MKGLGKVHPVVVLFDEIEKAHPRILDKFLQVMITFYIGAGIDPGDFIFE
jgi:hypothetical protein